VKDQLRRLFNARISYRWRGRESSVRKSIEITSEEVLWWSPQSADQPALFDSYIILGDAFFRDIVTRPVPIKLEALELLKRSPLALDLYTWATFRTFSLKAPTALSWESLKRQLGAEYTSTDEFARRCRKYLREIMVVYPDLRVEFPRGRLLLTPSLPHVSARAKTPF
jgi:hypothetical protein